LDTCCARTKSGHAAAPAMNVMNCRRFTASPEAQDSASYRVRIRLGTGRPMSALGHKRTYAVQKGMSALPPITTAKATSRKRSCPLYPRKQTCAVHWTMSALGHKRTHAAHQRATSFDNLLGASEVLSNGPETDVF